jgi:hypothetical protein
MRAARGGADGGRRRQVCSWKVLACGAEEGVLASAHRTITFVWASAWCCVHTISTQFLGEEAMQKRPHPLRVSFVIFYFITFLILFFFKIT